MDKFFDKCVALQIEGNAYLADWAERFKRQVWLCQAGAVRYGSAEALLTLAVIGFVIMLLLYNMFPTLSTANQAVQTMTETDSGTTTSKTIFGMLLWLFPLGIGIALVIRVFRHK